MNAVTVAELWIFWALSAARLLSRADISFAEKLTQHTPLALPGSELKLTTTDHSSDIAGLTYVYPVISRRAGGLSIGINFNINNSCNWRCIYCQVPDLNIGVAPAMNFRLLKDELRFFLDLVLYGDFYERFNVAEHNRVIKDIAIAGNGEPTSLKKFPEAVELIGKIATQAGVFPGSRYILITNGSLLHQARIQDGLQRLKKYGGEIWFKLDSATEEGKRFINNAGQGYAAGLRNLILASKLCPTRIQTCLFDYDKRGLPLQERKALLSLLKAIKADTDINQVMLYTLARTSRQPEAVRLEKLPEQIMNAFAEEIRLLGYDVSVSA